MSTFKRSMAWLRKYNDVDTNNLPEALKKRLFRFRIMRGIVLVTASAWLFLENLETLIIAIFGLIALFILNQFVEPKLDRDIANCTQDNKKEV